MFSSLIFSRVEALAAKLPASASEIDELLGVVIEVLKRRFDAYLIDIMWEHKQGARTELRAVKMFETEKHGYESRPIYETGKNLGAPDSLTGWCYEHNDGIWIVDEDGLARDKQHINLWGTRATDVIPADTIYEYNQKRMHTEICYPLRIYMNNAEWNRAAGVLNIEIPHAIYPSGTGREYVIKAASVIEQLQNRRLAAETANRFARQAMQQLLTHHASLSDEPGLVPTAFVARPMRTPGADNLVAWIEACLRERGIRCLLGQANDTITEEIFKDIRSSHFGVVVSTGYNRNVLFEWGYLRGAGKPIIRLHATQGDSENDFFDVQSEKRWPLCAEGKQITKEGVASQLGQALDLMMKQKDELGELLTAANKGRAVKVPGRQPLRRTKKDQADQK